MIVEVTSHKLPHDARSVYRRCDYWLDNDAILMIGQWFDGRLPNGARDFGREFLVINGRPWPHTERLTYAMGDSIRWRLINVSQDTHAMHLHGFVEPARETDSPTQSVRQ